MVLLSLDEIKYIIVLTLALGYIFSGFIKRPKSPFETYSAFNLNDIIYAALVAAPAVILHEFGHKFVAMAFGLDASFHVYWFGLGLGVILKLVNAPFLILAPAYVSIPMNVTPLQGFLTAFAGPFVNLMLWLGSMYLLKYGNLAYKYMALIATSAKINKILFIFNMIPFPPLDGYKVFMYLMQLINGVF